MMMMMIDDDDGDDNNVNVRCTYTACVSLACDRVDMGRSRVPMARKSAPNKMCTPTNGSRGWHMYLIPQGIESDTYQIRILQSNTWDLLQFGRVILPFARHEKELFAKVTIKQLYHQHYTSLQSQVYRHADLDTVTIILAGKSVQVGLPLLGRTEIQMSEWNLRFSILIAYLEIVFIASNSSEKHDTYKKYK